MSENRHFWRGECIRLRAIEQKDIDEPGDEPDTELDRYIGEIGFPQSQAADRAGMQELANNHGKEDYLFLQIENLEGQVVGFIHSHDCVRRNGTFKYAIGIQKRYWRNGYGREAILIFLRYFFRELRYQKCTTPIYAFNEQSVRFHEALGFRFEGRIRSMVYTNGQYYDELYYGITATEWEQIDPPISLEQVQASAESEER